MRAAIEDILGQERSHLKRFTAMQEADLSLTAAQRTTLQEQARSMLFPGGLMAMMGQIDGKDPASLWEYAARSEDTAVERYVAYAAHCKGAAQEAFLSIAKEEREHLKVFSEEAEERRRSEEV